MCYLIFLGYVVSAVIVSVASVYLHSLLFTSLGPINILGAVLCGVLGYYAVTLMDMWQDRKADRYMLQDGAHEITAKEMTYTTSDVIVRRIILIFVGVISNINSPQMIVFAQVVYIILLIIADRSCASENASREYDHERFCKNNPDVQLRDYDGHVRYGAVVLILASLSLAGNIMLMIR